MTLTSILRITAAAVFVAAGAASAHLATIGKAGSLGIPFAAVCALGAGISLCGRFEWDISSVLGQLGKSAREVASTSAELGALLSGLLFLAVGIVLARIIWIAFGSSLLSLEGGLWELLGWCFLAGPVLCFAKCAADWSIAFKPEPATLDNEKAHGRAGKATQAKATARVRGVKANPAWADDHHID